MKCKYCNTEIEQDAQFCSNCGKDLSKFDKCVKCGELLDQDAAFCPHCGTEQPHEEVGEESSSKKWIWILCTVLGIVLIVGGAGWYFFIRDYGVSKSKEKDAMASTERAESNNTVIESEEDNATPPTIQELGMMFSSITKNEKILDYGFKLIDKKSKSDDDEVYGDYTIYKEIYEKYYKIGDSGKDGQMTIECVYSPTYGDPSMTLKCDTETWNYMKNTAKNTMKELSPNYFFLNEYAYIGFTNTNIITITSECSISW